MKKLIPTVDGYLSYVKFYRKTEELDLSLYSTRNQDLITQKWIWIENTFNLSILVLYDETSVPCRILYVCKNKILEVMEYYTILVL